MADKPSATTIINTSLPDLKLLSQGKVRDIYVVSDPSALLFVATDRISAYDVILNNGIPTKGQLLTALSLFWFKKLAHIIPNHLITASIAEMPLEVQRYADQLEGRSMLVKKAEVIPIEAIVRGYITGSAWAEYKKTQTVHGIPLPAGLVESQKLPKPIFTPSTKAEQGAHDENISPERAAQLLGQDLYDEISSTALQLYKTAADYAETRGVILADTKFEFGLLPLPPGSAEKRQLILIDEVLTPDSSRYWPLEGYTAGKPQPSFDKQYVRDWLVASGFRKGLESGPKGSEGEGWTIKEDVVEGTRTRYQEAVDLLTR
ncbi:SAICAR synthetase [Macrolepiota fuliginosa MF-IS2]|uniref:Phosphoribosylaminoimidazole-succinocarboxamide synthase n=1 Tax=Macrolepiota fuliginosa MF-IS2 TaxID=1400762 RepID=A0A9P5XCG0_9AGAR|nr:SAICAR synthetase [Macrolepiota fuliginosa MF-IS2]